MFTTEDLFQPDDLAADWAAARELRFDVVDGLRRAPVPGVPDLEAAIALTELLQTEFVAFGTGGGQQLQNQDVALCTQALRATVARLSLSWSPRWRDFESFRSYWLSHDGHGSWGARRVMVAEEYGDLLRRLYERQDAAPDNTVVPQALDALPDASAIHDHLRRLGASIDTDPRLAVSVAKNLVGPLPSSSCVSAGCPTARGTRSRLWSPARSPRCTSPRPVSRGTTRRQRPCAPSRAH